ncbi:MAG: ASKHA domain-containing protein [Acidimicrobiaceae bacterium]
MDRHVVFTPSGLDGVVQDGITVLEAARQLGADIDSVCGGRGICGRCQITPSVGVFAKWGITATPDSLSGLAETETNYRAKRALVPGNRLGCAARICGDVVIDVPAISQVHKQIVRKDLDLEPITVDPSFSLFYLMIPEAQLGDSVSAAGALADAVAVQHKRSAPSIARRALSSLHLAMAKAQGEVTVAVRHLPDGDQIVAAWPGYVDAAYGIAVDVGSTTVAGHLCELKSGEIVASFGLMNPQIRFGEDLMSRVSYVMMNPGGEVELTNAIRAALNEMINGLVSKADIDVERVLEITIVGNPIMHHIVLGIDPTPLGMAPFVLATSESVSGWANELDLKLPNASYYVGPCIAGHVGADTAAAILAEGPHRSKEMQLLVDIGTNAEIVLGDTQKQFAASSPTGPAFEGAQISAGQRATAGAIEHIRIDRETLEPRVKVIGSDLWSNEPGFVESLGDTAVTGICGSGIIEVIGEMYLSGIIDQDGVVRGELANKSSRIVGDDRTFSYLFYESDETKLYVTQNDVRAIQLAKAALRAGIDLLVEHAGSPIVHDIRLAGAFGAHIDPVYAMVLGLVPDCPVAGVRAVGNAAGAGAVQSLLSRKLRHEMEDAVRKVTKIETATEPRFQQLFVEAMAFPHKTAETPNLAKVIDLPARSLNNSDGQSRAGRRRRSASGVAE